MSDLNRGLTLNWSDIDMLINPSVVSRDFSGSDAAGDYTSSRRSEGPYDGALIYAVNDLVAMTGAKIVYGSGRAVYQRDHDTISIPDVTRFRASSTDSAAVRRAKTTLHELAHWTGHKRRLARKTVAVLGEGWLNPRTADLYANDAEKAEDFVLGCEEIVAETCAALLVRFLEPRQPLADEHAQYICYYLDVLHLIADCPHSSEEILAACGLHARRAAYYILDCGPGVIHSNRPTTIATRSGNRPGRTP